MVWLHLNILLVEIIIALFFNGLAMSQHVSCVTALRSRSSDQLILSFFNNLAMLLTRTRTEALDSDLRHRRSRCTRN